MKQVPRDALRVVSYLDVDALGDRVPNLMPLWDGESWHLWLPAGDELIEMRPSNARFVDYVAVKPCDESDLWIPFVDLMWQRASWPDVCHWIGAILDDFHNMATSAGKLRFIWEQREKVPDGLASKFSETEVEYLLMLSRSSFDLLQEMIKRIWDKVFLREEGSDKLGKGKQLPEGFAKVVLDGDRPRTIDEIRDKFGVPEGLARAYADSADFFKYLRDARGSVVHGGGRVDTVFVTDAGLCVNPGQQPFSGFDGWDDSHHFNENLVSLLPWLAFVVLQTIGACTAITRAFASTIEFPPEVAPGFRVFVRAPTTRYLYELLEVGQGNQSPWWE